MGARPRRASAGPGDARDGRGHRAEIAGDVAFDDGNERGVIVGEGDAPAWQQRGGGEAGDPEACARFGVRVGDGVRAGVRARVRVRDRVRDRVSEKVSTLTRRFRGLPAPSSSTRGGGTCGEAVGGGKRAACSPIHAESLGGQNGGGSWLWAGTRAHAIEQDLLGTHSARALLLGLEGRLGQGVGFRSGGWLRARAL